MIKVSPSVMCINTLELKEKIEILDKCGVDMYHIDVMDGEFVPNFCLNRYIVHDLKSATNTPLDIHLMVTEPDRYISDFVEAGADIISIHIEAARHPIRVLRQIRQCGCKSAIAIDPATGIDSIEYLLDYLDMILIMTVDPGFAGQEIIPSIYEKIKKLRKMLDAYGKKIDIQVDGQVKEDTAPRLVECGANVLVLGSSGLFKYETDEYAQVIAKYKALK